MDISSLEIFSVVAEEGSITRAAQRLNRVQSNVTTRVQQLEQQLGIALFQREGKRMILTAEGENFMHYAHKLISLTQEALQSVHASQPTGQLRIGTMEATVASRLPRPLSRFHQKWPEVSLVLSTGPSQRLLEGVAEHRFDCALAAIPAADLGQTLGSGLTGIALWTEQLVLIAPKTPGTGRALSLAAFAQGCAYRKVAEEWFREQTPKQAPVLEMHSYHAIIASVMAGACTAVLPQSVLDLYPRIAVTKTARLGEITTWLVWRNQYNSASLAAFSAQCQRDIEHA